MFNPKAELTRGEAAGWIYNAIRVLETHIQKPAPVEDVSVTVEKVTDDVNKVTLSRGQKPNSGYSIAIQNVRFDKNGQAVISYTLQDPKPDTMYADVITEAKAVTYVSSAYKAVAEPAAAN